ncbi:nucleotidyl transferase AbiEii/AbiGii toxin family protein [Streptomyces cocklensis]|uniref:Nucleotidyl transferase AbiEii toxin, Type IV TA system n=1 Tax=Actinacidiphila cocklensis TaxID=887465 RepID=A0A9W4DWJ2_9ACTN|nr:nucleotidyl transferase AbiEii/AbiGii toxin family protein [Actinacidiphila cocklensis]MDD1064084.1 nucleotidyl transferase AbiEii/AbiGii toxin family protein [Actinacidiphila cocklensis]CAG6395220.1 conserved hypothetical protein [Actinacidiphila cocklensis]
MDEQHHRLIRIALDALADDYGYALAGGYAIQAHHIVQRVSEDVDLFAPFARARQEMPEATTRVATAYEAASYSVDVAQQVETYTRLTVTDPATGTRTKVELVAEFLHDSDLGPVLHPDDLAAGKTSALFSRTEVRDAIDVDGLIKAGYTRARLMELAAENDAGFDQRMFADSLARVQRYTDKQFAAYRLTPAEAGAIRQTFATWQHELAQPPSPGNEATDTHTSTANLHSPSTPAGPTSNPAPPTGDPPPPRLPHLGPPSRGR